MRIIRHIKIRDCARKILFYLFFTFYIIANSQSDYSGMIQVDTNLWVDQTEITNYQYRQFVNWVRDSIARKIVFEAGLKDYGRRSISNNSFQPNWEKHINYNDSLVKKILYESNEFYINPQERFYNRFEININKLKYTYINDSGNSIVINIYPDTSNMLFYTNFRGDTLVNCNFWDEHFYCRSATFYFFHPNYSNYPVVNITYNQAKAFCHWRSNLLNNLYSKNKSDLPRVRFSLPSIEQWNYISDHSKLSEGLYNKRAKEDSSLTINEYFSKYQTVYYGGNTSVDFRYTTNASDEDLRSFSKRMKRYYNMRFKNLKSKKRKLRIPHCIVSLDTYPFEQNETYFKDDNFYISTTLLPVAVDNQFSFTPSFVSKKKKKILGFAGNVAEMTIEGKVIGGSFHHPLAYCKRGVTIEHDANKPERWLGFRCVLVQLRKK